MEKIRNPDFTNKFVWLSIAGLGYNYALNRPRFELQGGRLFLIGKMTRGGSNNDWSQGATCAVAWDRITDYMVFKSEKDYLKRVAKAKRNKGRA